jgi:diadenosine tetraphosphate (Ap4A) HIT family hydrolase
MSSEATCMFCRVIAGEAQASLVYRDELVTSFMDILPVNDGHLLVVPNRHSSNLAGLDEATGGRMFAVAMRLGAALRTIGLSCEGVNLYLADGQAAGQEVMHVHLHVLPRFVGDGFGLRRAKRLSVATREELDALAARVRGCLGV